MKSDDGRERQEVWSRYWASGARHSCATTYAGDYAGPIADFWRSAFAMLAPGDRMLDVATGNAPLPHLLLQTRGEASIECDAVDMARITPPWLNSIAPMERQRIRLHSGVAAESLPFANRTFSLVVSQYGIEYADLARAVPELLRVLSPRGHVRIVAHHAGSRPVHLARAEISHIDWLSADEGLLDLVSAMLPLMARATTAAGRAALSSDPHATRTRQHFNSMQDLVSARIASGDCPDVLHEVREAIGWIFHLATTQGCDKAAHALKAVRDRLADSRFRLEELLVHALDEDAARSLCTQLSRTGCVLALMPLSDAGHLLGWTIAGDPSP